MSGEIVTFVSQHKAGSAARKAILMIFAESANDKGCGIWKSHRTIADRAEISVRTVQRLISDMVEEGLILHVGFQTTNGITTKHYDLDLDAIAALPKVKSDSGFKAIERENRDLTNCHGGDTEYTNDDTDDTKHVSSVTQTVQTAQTVPSIHKRGHETMREFIDAVYARWNRMVTSTPLKPVNCRTEDFERDKHVLKRLAACRGDESLVMQAIDNIPNNSFWIDPSGFKPRFNWFFAKHDNFQAALEYTTPDEPEGQNHANSSRNSDIKPTAGQLRSRREDEAAAAAIRILEREEAQRSRFSG